MALAPAASREAIMDIKSLLKESFHSDDAKLATLAIETARERIETEANTGAFSLEVLVPKVPDERWLRERVLRPLIYFAQSAGVPPPSCTGVFVSLFHRSRIYCVLGAEVIAWAAEQLGVTEQSLIAQYGTGETEQAAPRAPA
jgi:hypothetical protein